MDGAHAMAELRMVVDWGILLGAALRLRGLGLRQGQIEQFVAPLASL